MADNEPFLFSFHFISCLTGLTSLFTVLGESAELCMLDQLEDVRGEEVWLTEKAGDPFTRAVVGVTTRQAVVVGVAKSLSIEPREVCEEDWSFSVELEGVLGDTGVKALAAAPWVGRVECLTLTFFWGPGDFSGGRVWALRVVDNELRRLV